MQRRTIILIALSLVAGFIAQALLAAVLALRSPLASSGYDSGLLLSYFRNPVNSRTEWPAPGGALEELALATAFDMWPALGRPSSNYQQFSVQFWVGPGITFASGFVDDGVASSVEDIGRVRQCTQRYTAGWPLASMRAVISCDDPAPSFSSGPPPATLHGGFLAPASWLAPDRAAIQVNWQQPAVLPVIPLRPILLGTIVNTLTFAAPLLTFGWAFVLTRRTLRVRRGLCPRCGYNRAGLPARSTPCPECGHALHGASRGRPDQSTLTLSVDQSPSSRLGG